MNERSERRLIGFHLLDRQVIDRDGLLVGKVDDIELTADGDEAPVVAALLLGPQALGDRIGGRLGRLIADLARRLHPDGRPNPTRVPWGLVEHVDTAVHLSVGRAQIPEPALESWLREHVIDRIVGVFGASE
jgi:sporulation protein YlmC with PRC-barrel domain